ncbi:Secreted protein OS=Streptomyces tendae OX=1932 GN=GUR47_15670 PE=4 SV=1 [Streptomyces tendae]
MAELQGSNGLLLRITSAERDSGGFVTVNGELKNDGDKSVAVPSGLSGNETEIIKNGRSLGGATLVDSEGARSGITFCVIRRGGH